MELRAPGGNGRDAAACLATPAWWCATAGARLPGTAGNFSRRRLWRFAGAALVAHAMVALLLALPGDAVPPTPAAEWAVTLEKLPAPPEAVPPPDASGEAPPDLPQPTGPPAAESPPLAAPEPPPPTPPARRHVAAPAPAPRHRDAAAPPAERRPPVSVPPPEEAAAPAVAAPLVPPRPVAGMAGNRPPSYPERSRQRREQGRVLLRVEVSADGAAVAVAVAQSSGHPALDEAASMAVRQWRFIAATRGGTAVAATAEVPVVFTLTD
jgi:protein TonB